jgi:uncharacterized protein DUF4177
MARYQYLTVHMYHDPDEGFVPYEKGIPHSSLGQVLAEYADKGWRYVAYVPTTYNTPTASGQLVFERESA